MNNEDAGLVKILATTPHKHEALSWLQQPDGKERTIGDGGSDEAASLQLVKDLYHEGAAQVIAVDIESDAHMETTSTLIVKLPQETQARSRVFKIEAKVGSAGGFDPSDDTGQEYLMLHW